MQQVTLTKQQARKIIIHAAALHQQAPFGTGPEAVYKVIEHVGFLQIDTNYVVERAHHHALACRVPDYRQEWLYDLQEDGRIFEFLVSDSGYMPMQEFRFSLPIKQSFLVNRKPLTPAEANLMNKVLDRIAREGPLMVKDFDNDRQVASQGWWDWRPSKMALERLYFDGSLMATRGKDFHKIYDLPINLVPQDIDTSMPTPEEFARHIIKRTLKSLGISYTKEMAWRAHRVKDNVVKKELEKLVAEGEVCQVVVEGIKTAPLYMLPGYENENENIQLCGDAFILSPFDTLNVFRHRLRDFFGFDYQIECFVPAPKRKYGYFSLPVLVGDTFIARMDAKADRKKGVLTIHNLHFEEVTLAELMVAKLAGAINGFAKFNQCQAVSIEKSNNAKVLKVLGKAVLG